MNIIQFKVIETGHFGKRLDIEIDGKPLAEILKAIELPMAVEDGYPNRAGSYGLMDIPSNPSYTFLGGKDDAFWGENENKTALLACDGCGDQGCWSILCKIDVDNETVRWSNFEHMHRDVDEWDYSGFEGFVFSTAQYLDAIHAISADPQTKKAH